jgi:HEPN domain-containing protein
MTPAEPEFERDPGHWLFKHTSDEWIEKALSELEQAREAFESHQTTAGLAGVKRAAGMALNGALIRRPDPGWGRTYIEHLRALVTDARAPLEVRDAAKLVADASPAVGEVLPLRTRSSEAKLVEAARTVMAHAYAIVHGTTGRTERPV